MYGSRTCPQNDQLQRLLHIKKISDLFAEATYFVNPAGMVAKRASIDLLLPHLSCSVFIHEGFN
jgi:hypothetical protein